MNTRLAAVYAELEAIESDKVRYIKSALNAVSISWVWVPNPVPNHIS